jgi:methylenetetrahydrofolate--tRNA-(uracil-5-)-methyltransferase
MNELMIIGGGLAGSEAAWQAAQLGVSVALFEMRPAVQTGAHQSGCLSELVCSNSFGSQDITRSSGLLQGELGLMNSIIIACAHATSIPSGSSLAVDREGFADLVTQKISSHPNIRVLHQELTEIPQSASIIATGPLTSPKMANALQRITGYEHLFFYDAISPIINLSSINMNTAFRASRYQKGTTSEGDYINCPFSEDLYTAFIAALLSAEVRPLKPFEEDIRGGVKTSGFFEGCLPVEILAKRGAGTLAFGPMRPTGLKNPVDGQRPYAVAQLRQDNLAGTLYNLVGFQTNLCQSAQNRVFRLIPGLEDATFARYGEMHRNTYISAPSLINPALQLKARPDLFFAGQITGVEGYAGNIATGLIAGINAARYLKGQPLIHLPLASMIGSLIHYITHAQIHHFQPVKANFGLLPAVDGDPRDKSGKKQRQIQNALDGIQAWKNLCR